MRRRSRDEALAELVARLILVLLLTAGMFFALLSVWPSD